MADEANTDQAKEVATARRSVAFPGLENEFERFFGNRWPKLFDWPELKSAAGAPNVDVVDREEEVCVRAEVPGFRKADIEVSVSGSSVTIKATREESSSEEEGDYLRREMSRGYLSRTVALPAEVDGDKADARLRDGVLEITVPKLARARRQNVPVTD